MADQTSTPGSNGDHSVNAGKHAAPKDKACPFCQQPFTSSSLGRHLDLYIREKNPKPEDGVHDVDAIKKLRGGITRRQPRNSTSKRETSTPASNAHDRRSPFSEIGGRTGGGGDAQSPTGRRESAVLNSEANKNARIWHGASWEATGVINDIPSITGKRSLERWDPEGDEAKADRRAVDERQKVNRQLFTKTALEQRQKLQHATDTARAAELALREILGSMRAANRRVKPPTTPFDYDPLSLDFPALVIHCLPPPPTINSITPIASPTSWSVTPPEVQQLDALRNHFREAFHSWRVRRVVSSSVNPDELLTYTSEPPSTPAEEAEMHAQATALEEKVAGHLNAAFAHWCTLSPQIQSEIWRLQLAKAVGQKDQIIAKLKGDQEKILQENAHLRAQVDQLSRCQQPKEFQMMPPSTIPISARVAVEISEIGLRGGGVGLNISDKDAPIEDLVKTAVGRWLDIVQKSRTNASIAGEVAQRSALPPTLRQIQNAANMQRQDVTMGDLDADGDADADAEVDEDADADGEGEENYMLGAGQLTAQARAPEAQMGMMAPRYGNHAGANGTPVMARGGINGQYR